MFLSTGLCLMISMTYIRIASLAIFVLSQGMCEGGSCDRDAVPPGKKPFSKKEMPA
jgi:hypothetical protein